MTEQNPLVAWIAGLQVSLQTETPEDKKNKAALFQMLETSLPTIAELPQIKSPSFLFENIVPATLTELSPGLQTQISRVSDQVASLSSTKEFKVFQRESPVRSIRTQRSVPSWANGAAVAKTIGPLINIDGRRVWFDFFKVEKLVALYDTGSSNPAILFNIDVSKYWSGENTPLLAPVEKHYVLTGNSSIWISSQILASNAPMGNYTGLTIESGTIDLSISPVITGGKTTITPTTFVTVKIKLKQQVVTDADPASPYGADARAANYHLPSVFEFQFQGSAGQLNVISDASWNLFNQPCSFKWNHSTGIYIGTFFSLFIPLVASEQDFIINKSLSPFAHLSGQGKILESSWELPSATLDLTNILPAAGIGGLAVLCAPGLSASWSGLLNGAVNLNTFLVVAQPEGIALGTTVAGNFYCRQNFTLWKDEKNPYASTVKIDFGKQFALQFFSTVNGYEIVNAVVDSSVEVDRPIDVSARPFPVNTKGSFFSLIAFEKQRTIILYDSNLLQDNFVPGPPSNPFELPLSAIALENALFTTTSVVGCFLLGELAMDWNKIVIGNLYLSMGIYKYIPMLPDPYAANVSIFQHFKDYELTDNIKIHIPIMLLLCQVKWGVRGPNLPDDVNSSFHLLPYSINQGTNQISNILQSAGPANSGLSNLSSVNASGEQMKMARQGNDWSRYFDGYFFDDFALVDVSSHANQMGVSFGHFSSDRSSLVVSREFGVETQSDQLQSLYSVPFKIEQVQMMSPSLFVRSFALPQIAWEPVHNLTPKKINGDPPAGMNFYPDDGGPTRITNNSIQYVPLAPKPVIKDIIDRYNEEKNNLTLSYFTLPFGLKALAALSKNKQKPNPPSIQENRPVFSNDIRGGIQVQFNAGKLSSDQYPMFNGATIQLANVLDASGSPAGAGTLGESVSAIFNTEFTPKAPIITSRGVPITRIDFSGYGASTFSNWFNPNAEIAQTSQTKFDVFIGRTAHEVIQVRSLVYPWGIHVVRTIILYRTDTGYVYRVDTGWQAESDGKFNFTYFIQLPGDTFTTPFSSNFKIHPGVVLGLFNIQNIVEINIPAFKTNSAIKNNQWYLDPNNNPVQNLKGSDIIVSASLQKITFDADVEIEGAVLGQVNRLVPSKGIVGYVQLAPMGIPLSANALTALITSENGSIGGPLDCVVDINNSKQRMRLNRFDVSNEINLNTNGVFVAAGRGNVLLPKDGSWSMVTHQASSGDVSPLPENITIPLIRVGELQMTSNGDVQLGTNPVNQLLRIANPTEILRAPSFNTINYGFLQNTGTQKALFLTPAFQSGVQQLLSKTPPLFADAYRIISSKSIFPNIGDAVSNFKDAIPLNADHFLPGSITDAGAQVLQLMQVANNVADAAGQLQDQAYKLLRSAEDFDLPTTPLSLIDEDFLKLFIEYQTTPTNPDGTKGATTQGKLNYDMDSLAGATADKAKSMMGNLAMVVTLGPFDRLMLIKGNFNSQKGSESNFQGSATDPSLPSAEIEFSPALQTVVQILQILQDLSGGDYKDAMAQGLKIAMSNNAGTWEYKFEASKEIPLIRFPLGLLYNDPEVPLKLEASLKVGVYFNSSLMVTNDLNQLLPTVGAYLGFYGQLTVMCVSLAAATVYAVGQVTLDIAADTAKGPSLDMKFGFGVQLVVGLPVVGNVSVLYMVGVEIFTSSTEIKVTAFLLFKGHAELLGGIVGITITIEASGTIDRTSDRTDCSAQVTFAIDISIFLVIDIDFSTSWEESRQIA